MRLKMRSERMRDIEMGIVVLQRSRSLLSPTLPVRQNKDGGSASPEPNLFSVRLSHLRLTDTRGSGGRSADRR